MPQRALPHPCTVTIHIVTALIKQRTIESVMILRNTMPLLTNRLDEWYQQWSLFTHSQYPAQIEHIYLYSIFLLMIASCWWGNRNAFEFVEGVTEARKRSGPRLCGLPKILHRPSAQCHIILATGAELPLTAVLLPCRSMLYLDLTTAKFKTSFCFMLRFKWISWKTNLPFV